MGALATAILVANNLRDRPTDAKVGKHTLAVKLDDARTRALFVFLTTTAVAAGAACALWAPWALLCLGALALAIPQVMRVQAGATGRDLIPVLSGTGVTQLLYAVLLTVGLWLGR